MQKKLFLLDAMALIFRAYYALLRNPRKTRAGKNTNAQFGFTNTLLDLLNNQKPTHIAVCFDTPEPTERHTEFADYKANRQEAPEDLISAIPDIKKIIEAFNIPVIELPGYEADDIIGALAKQADQQGYEVFMVTPDKDYGQLVSDNVKIYKPGYQGGAVEILGPKEVCEKWGIEKIDQVVDLLGLMGDSADNIPGIPGIGEKTAAKLIKEFGSMENILANANNIKGALGEKVRNGKELALLSKKLATILTDIPVIFHEKDFQLNAANHDRLMEIMTELEFKTLGKRILGEEVILPVTTSKETSQLNLFGHSAQENPITKNIYKEASASLPNGRNINNTPHKYIIANTHEAIEEMIKDLNEYNEICFDTETTGLDPNTSQLVGISFSAEKHTGYYIPCPSDKRATHKIIEQLKSLFYAKGKTWIGHNVKFDLLVLKHYGIDWDIRLFDTMLAHYVIEPEGRRSMDLLSEIYLGYQPVPIEELIGKKGKGQGNMRDVEIDIIKEYAVEDADVTLQLKAALLPLLSSKDVEKVFYEIENPLVKVLADMEFEGIRIDKNFLTAYGKKLKAEAEKFEKNIYTLAGTPFNIASPKQLGEILFEKLKLDENAKKTKTGQYATGEDILLKLAEKHTIAEDILSYREISKLKSTYVDALPELIYLDTGRIHTSYSQASVVTGRLASSNPNLQNIPVRTERGREIRKAFIPRNEDYVLLSADYSQIELRIVAAISGDENMIKAFSEGKDIHTATAALIFNTAEADVSKEMRYKAKSVNFGIIYGQSAFGLSENLKISRGEAKEIIDNYKKKFPKIQQYMDDTIAYCKTNGYVKTLMGRKRWLTDINSANFTVRGFAERNAINSPIQGSAADMIKLAMILIHKELKAHQYKSKMLLQVHDELVFDVHRKEIETIKPLILDCMQNALQLPNNVPVIAEIGVGSNWLEAH